jgi:hypothetical protein
MLSLIDIGSMVIFGLRRGLQAKRLRYKVPSRLPWLSHRRWTETQNLRINPRQKAVNIACNPLFDNELNKGGDTSPDHCKRQPLGDGRGARLLPPRDEYSQNRPE